jgi:formylglycine-generating enzyme required for sulfatase activity
MKLFISYSRDDTDFALDLWRRLREPPLAYDAWIDQHLKGASRWWEEICRAIDGADYFIMILTPRSVGSIYCQAELDYALRLNVPVIPLILKACDVPDPLKPLQWIDLTHSPPRDTMLLLVSQGISALEIERLRHPDRYQRRSATPPPTPTPETSADVDEVFDFAVDLLEENHLEQAETRFVEVVKIAGYDTLLGKLALARLETINNQRRADREYRQMKRLLGRKSTREDGVRAYHLFVADHPDYPVEETVRKSVGTMPASSVTATTPSQSQNTDTQERASTQSSSLKTVGATHGSPANTPTSTKPDILPPPFDWIEIPGGSGTLKTDESGVTLQIPTERYWIAKYPLTNAQFAKFIEAGGYKTEKWWTEAGWQQRKSKGWTEPRYWDDNKWNGSNQPVVGVSWYEAVAFCLWLSDTTGDKIMLPTEAQWQYAAQGTDGRDYPWGKEWDSQRCQNSGGTSLVTKYEGKGDSPFGVVDMAGNVWEWCLTEYNGGNNDINGTDVRVLRGGSWDPSDTDNFRCDYRGRVDPNFRGDNGGFRLALS